MGDSRLTMFLFTKDSPGLYRPIHLRLLLAHGNRSELLVLSIAWALTCIVCVYFGWWCVADFELYKAYFTLELGGFTTTLFPPLPICLLWVLLCGYWWGAIPSYFSTLTLALLSGMPVAWALLFACTNPICFLVYSIVYRALPVQISLRRLGSILFFTIIGLLSAVLTSAGSFIWSHTNELSTAQLIENWQDWWLGGFVTQVLFVGPVLFAVVPAIERIKDRKVWAPAIVQMAKRDIVLLLGLVVASILIFCLLTLQLNQELYRSSIESGDFKSLGDAYCTALQSSHAVYWVMGTILALVVVLSFQFYNLWTKALADAKTEAESQARTDHLTGLYNRRAFFEFAHNITQQAKRYDRPYAISILDIDHFKSVNDTWGHDVGDEVLKAVSEVIAKEARGADIVARFGGEEFILMMPETDLDRARVTAERIRRKVEEQVFKGKDGKNIKLNISGGIACLSSTEDNLGIVIQKADAALYEAKRSGRNRVEGFSEKGSVHGSGADLLVPKPPLR